MSFNRPATAQPRDAQTRPPLPWAPGETSRRSERALPLARRYELSWLDNGGRIDSRVEIAPALPVFEDAFSAFTHGVLIQTTKGDIPVEDLDPGTMLICPNGREARLMWKGAITLVPGAPSADDRELRLFRVMADAFGPGRPSRDLLLGPAARRLVRNGEVRAQSGSEAALMRLAEAADGIGVIAVVPAQPVRVYHLVAEDHATILADGLEVETYHPGPQMSLSLSSEMKAMFAALFPHQSTADGFGRSLWPRLDLAAAEGELLG